MGASSRARGSGLGWVFTAFFGVFGWATGLSKLSDNSFFWHLRTGEYILDHGIPHHDVFSYTAPGTKWVAQSWLAEVTYAVLYRSVGGIGIRLLVGAVGAGIGILTYRLALRLVRDRIVACGLTVAALAGIYTVWSERPLLIGVLFLLVLLWVVEVPDCIVGRHPLVVIPVLMWLWANTHGTYQLGFAYLGLHLVGRWLDGAPPWAGRERRLLTGAAIAFAAVFVNPYGVELVTFPIDLLSRGDILSHIVEWKSPDFRQAWGVALGLWIVVFVVALSRGRHRVTRRDLVVTVPMLLLALWAVRNVAVAPLIGLPVVARAFARDEEKPSELSAHVGHGRDHRARAGRRGDGIPGVDREDVQLLHLPGRVDALRRAPRPHRAVTFSRPTPPPATSSSSTTPSSVCSSTTATTCTRGR